MEYKTRGTGMMADIVSSHSRMVVSHTARLRAQACFCLSIQFCDFWTTYTSPPSSITSYV